MRLDSFLLKPISAFRLDLTVWALRRRPDKVIDRWDGQTYCRMLLLLAGFAEIAVTQIRPHETPRFRVTVGAATLCLAVQRGVRRSPQRMHL